MPKLQQAVRELFPEAEVVSGISPDEVIATGAAKQGSYLQRPFDPDCEHLAMEVPAVSKPICVKVNLNMSTITCTVESFLLQVSHKILLPSNSTIMSAYLHVL
jgi:molecular chaperone DnaK (HSP70)